MSVGNWLTVNDYSLGEGAKMRAGVQTGVIF